MKKIEQEQEVKQVVWSGIAEICRHFGQKQSITILNYRRDLGCPIRKDGGILVAVESEVLAWAKDLAISDIRNIDHEEAYKIICRRLRSGPGRIIQGDPNELCETLKIASGTFIDIQKRTDNPFQKIEGTNKYKIDFNRWLDFFETIHLASNYDFRK